MPSFQGGQQPRSDPCVNGMHADCGHLYAVALSEGDGRVSLSVIRCTCTCHAACPLASWIWSVPRQVWQEQCTCPGTEQAARKLDEAGSELPDFAEVKRQLHEHLKTDRRARENRRTARGEAFDAARRRGAGKSREQAREIYVAELRARGVPMPSDLVLDAYADAIARNRSKFTVSYAARVLAELGKDLAEIRKRSRHPWNE